MADEPATAAGSVEACIGHVVLPMSRAAASASRGAEEAPVVKRARTEPQAPSSTLRGAATTASTSDVVQLAAWTTPSIRHALYQYAVDVLASMARDAGAHHVAPSSSPSSSPAAAAAVLQALTTQADAWAASWPSVVLSSPAAAQDGWCTMSFSFVPGALKPASLPAADAEADASALSSALGLDSAAWDVLARLPLPRGVCLDLGSASDSADDAAGCAACVLTERARVRHPFAAVPDPSPPLPRARACVTGALLPAAELRAKPILLVGAGGIGCELLKVLVLSGFTQIHLIDLDTIDATNLNRQFLFQTGDVGQSKAETARRVVLGWCLAEPPCIVAYHDNVKSERYDDDFYSQFAVVLNALDNVSARQHVNRMCMRNGIPLFESGTMGYNGQVQPILKDVFECYDCRPKPPDTKTFAVCTVHARPTTMVHCVHYAKELYEVLFGASAGAADAAADGGAPDSQGEDGGEAQGTKAAVAAEGELAYLRTMVSEWRSQQGLVCDPSSTPSGAADEGSGHRDSSSSSTLRLAAALLQLLFITKVKELLGMKSAWSTEPPAPLDDAALGAVVAAAEARTHAHGAPPPSPSVDHALSVTAYMELFITAVRECIRRPGGIAFRKEDDAAVRFVSAAANLRAHVFHIAVQSLEEVRSIAGSIVPAIATTNAIIAAAVVHELVALLQSVAATGSDPASTASVPRARVVYARKAPQSRRRRLPPCSVRAGVASALSPSLFIEYGASTSTAGPVRQTATSLVGTPCTAAALPALAGAPLAASRATPAVTDQYLVHSTLPNPPKHATCLVCQDVRPEVGVCLDWHATTVGALAHTVLESTLGLEGPSISHGPTVLFEDEDYEALADYSLADVLQLSTTPETAAGVARCTLTVDALNKDVAWHVRLTHTAGAAPTDGRGAAAGHFAVTGLERALVAEQTALARRAAAAEAAPAPHTHEGCHAPPAESSHGAVVRDDEAAAEVVISDDDDDVVEAMAPSAGSGTAAVAPASDAGDDEVVVLD